MVAMTKRRFASVTLLSIILPISLLATFRIAGIIPEPPTPQTITVETVYWNISRPSKPARLEQNVQSTYTYTEITVETIVYIDCYEENFDEPPFNSHDGIALRAGVNVSVPNGHVEFMVIRFLPNDFNALAFLDTNEYALKASNATITRRVWLGTEASEAYVIAQGSAASASLTTQLRWVFIDENLESHRLKLTFEAHIFNESTDEVVILPIFLNVLTANESS